MSVCDTHICCMSGEEERERETNMDICKFILSIPVCIYIKTCKITFLLTDCYCPVVIGLLDTILAWSFTTAFKP